jgi:hypothetical protein
MANPPIHTAYANNSQRAVSAYIKLLAPFKYVTAEGKFSVQEQEQRDLQAFFQALYANLYAQPELYGLPVRSDDSIAEVEPHAKEKKQEVKRLLDKPSAMIAAGLDFLMQAGVQSRLEGGALRLENYSLVSKETRVGKKFLAGLESTGLAVALSGDKAVLTHSCYTAMLPALQALANSCAAYHSLEMGKFMFANCDFRALNGYALQAMDLYRAFEGLEHQLVTELHAYFTIRNYKTEVGIHAPFAWLVKYQGDRKIKSTPLFQVEYDYRYARPLRLQIKCASTARLAAIIPKQPQLLQDDFERRVSTCRGDECGWCRAHSRNMPLGPADIAFHGDLRTVCWYTNPDICIIDSHTSELVRQYEQMHAQLAVLS